MGIAVRRKCEPTGNLFLEGGCRWLHEQTGKNGGIYLVRTIWKRINKECKLWLALEAEVERRGGTSGHDEIQVEQIVSDVFTTRTGKTDIDCICVPGAPFKFKRVAQFLASHPKWDRSLTGARKKKEVRIEQTDVASPPAGSASGKGRSRPIGKKTETEEARFGRASEDSQGNAGDELPFGNSQQAL